MKGVGWNLGTKRKGKPQEKFKIHFKCGMLGMANNLCTHGWKISPNFAVKIEGKARGGGSTLREEDPLLFFVPAFIGPTE